MIFRKDRFKTKDRNTSGDPPFSTWRNSDVWLTNNWQYYPAALEKVDEALSTLGGGQGVVDFFGMAKPVRTPLIGPLRQP